MLENTGWLNFHCGLLLGQAKELIEQWLKQHPDRTVINRQDHHADWPLQVLQSSLDAAVRLQLPTFVAELERAIEKHATAPTALDMQELLYDIERTRDRFGDELEPYKYLLVAADLVPYHEQEKLFGEHVFEKFPRARADITEAGSCYALRRPTACVFHLMRGMEAAIQKLARQLSLTITPQTTWRKITGDMDAKIRAMPDLTLRQKGRKDRWADPLRNFHS
jgi:hypothetical protein